MKLSRLVAVLGIALVLSVSGALGLVREATPEPPQVVAVADVGGAAPPAGADLDAAVNALQDRLRRLPADDQSWAALALAYVEQARVTGDSGYYVRAEDAVARSLDLRTTDNAAALASSAALAAARHDFVAALADADAALAVDPYSATALAVRVDALTELGRYDDQLAALRDADRRQPGVPTAARYAYAYELRGDLDRAAAILGRSAGTATGADRSYLLTLLADVDRRRGRLDAAAAHLSDARRTTPDDLGALVGQARLAVARGELATAAAHWQEVVARLPLPEYVVELGELYQHLGKDELARRQYDVVGTTQRLLAADGVRSDWETAVFEADHGSPAVAVRAARAEWQRRTSVHVADAYGWALHAAGDDRAALRVARSATRLGTAEALPWLHRGMIEAALGLDDAARTHLTRGLAQDPGLSPWQAARARQVLDSLGDAR